MRRFLWLAVLVLIGCESGQQPVESFTFTYAPPESVDFSVELSMMRTTIQGDTTVTDSTWSHTKHELRATDAGYNLTGFTDSIVMFHDGEEKTDRVVNLFASANIVYVIDTAGQAIEVLGYEEIFGRLEEKLGRDTADLVRQMITPAKLQQQELNTWNNKFGNFVNRQLVPGVVEIDTMSRRLPVEGQLISYSLTEVTDTVRINGALCGKIKIIANTDPSELARISGKTVEEVAELFSLTEDQLIAAAQRQAGASSTREWVLEYGTMLSHSENSVQEIFYYVLSGSGLPIQNRLTETQSKTFVY